MTKISSTLKNKFSGFTLAELLIALLILAVIATFSIPKVLNAQQNTKSIAAAKETMAMIAGAYQAYQLDHGMSASVTAGDLTQYMNYVKVDTSTVIDSIQTLTSNQCGVDGDCLKLHSGAILMYDITNNFGGISSNNFFIYGYDPDGTYSGLTTGPSKGIVFDVYYNGRIVDSTNRLPSAVTYYGSTPQYWGSDPISDWFSWN